MPLPLHEVTFCTEESQDESKDDLQLDELVTPVMKKEFTMSGGFDFAQSEDSEMR